MSIEPKDATSILIHSLALVVSPVSLPSRTPLSRARARARVRARGIHLQRVDLRSKSGESQIERGITLQGLMWLRGIRH